MIWAYIITLVLFVLLLWKVPSFRELISSDSMLKKFLKGFVSFLFIYLVIWSILNYWFYINMYILMENPNFHYDFFKSFHIAINLTNEYTTAWYYFTWYMGKELSLIFGVDETEQIVQQLQHSIDSLGLLSDTESGLSLLNDISKFFI